MSTEPQICPTCRKVKTDNDGYNTCRSCRDRAAMNRAAARENAIKCMEPSCTNKARANGFCGKHQKAADISSGKNLCSKTGCRNELTTSELADGLRQCSFHRAQGREHDANRKTKNSDKSALPDGMDRCQKCGAVFAVFRNLLNQNSTKCKACYDKQTEIERNRTRNR